MNPSTIKIFLVNGSPKGLRTAEISNWTGKAIACPRKELKDLLGREESKRAGVYILQGTDTDSEDTMVYVGEAEVIRTRLPGHSNKDFWNSAVVFTSKDENLTKSHIKFLEGKLIERAKELGRVKVDNSQSSGGHLPESDLAEMGVFLENVYQLLPILGIEGFNLSDIGSQDENTNVYYLRIKGVEARGKRTESGFLVFEGSEAVLEHRRSSVRSKKIREDLEAKGVLVISGKKRVFTRDFEFSSPSRAGQAVEGGACNGLTAWKTREGKSIKEVESEL
ncbi:GIY-YIG nuclease family protein [bacterium]|nr:GIY-YIG nuclease family protein [bacterium]